MAQDDDMITIIVRDTVTGIKHEEVELPANVPMTELLPIVIEEVRKSVDAEEGFASNHQLMNKTQGFEYSPNDTLADRSTQEGDICLLGYEFDAGIL